MKIVARQITYREWYAKFHKLLNPKYNQNIFGNQDLLENYFSRKLLPEHAVKKFEFRMDYEKVVKSKDNSIATFSKFYKT